jgi:hypothetical protein
VLAAGEVEPAGVGARQVEPARVHVHDVEGVLEDRETWFVGRPESPHGQTR